MCDVGVSSLARESSGERLSERSSSLGASRRLTGGPGNTNLLEGGSITYRQPPNKLD